MTAKNSTAQQDDPQAGTTAANGAGGQDEATTHADSASREDNAPQAESEQQAAATHTGDVSDTGDLEAQVRDLEDRLKRAVAETENVRRRADRERQDAVKYAVAPFARDILGVTDNLRRAIDSVAADQIEGNESLKSLLSGVEMTEKELLGALEKHNIIRMPVVPGDRFDPHRHEAMFEVPTDQQAPGTVVHILQDGYLLHDRLLRPARVGVAKAIGAQGNSGQSVDTSA